MSLSLPPRSAWLLLALLPFGNCSSHDVSLGEDLPVPVIDPDPPLPVPAGPQPCELNDPEAACIPASQHCSGRILTRRGFECPSGYGCCLQTVTTPPPGGASGVEPPAAGAGGQ